MSRVAQGLAHSQPTGNVTPSLELGLQSACGTPWVQESWEQAEQTVTFEPIPESSRHLPGLSPSSCEGFGSVLAGAGGVAVLSSCLVKGEGPPRAPDRP